MSLVLKHNESFYETLFKYFMNIFEFIVVAGIIVIACYMFHCIHDYWCKKYVNNLEYNLIELQKFKSYNRLITRQQSIIGHKEMLNTLEHAAEKCYEKYYALQCIDIVVHCPHLVNIKSAPYDLTPFHRVCLRGHTPLVTFMLAKGADPSLTTTRGENALCMAIYFFLYNPTKTNFSCLDILIEAGCRFGYTDQWYQTLLDMAFSSNHTKLVHWLILHHKDHLNNNLRSSSMPPI